MKQVLKVGALYENRFGKVVQIIEKKASRFIGDDGEEYGQVGVCLNRGKQWDLIDFHTVEVTIINGDQ
jgi:hypothetical protein